MTEKDFVLTLTSGLNVMTFNNATPLMQALYVRLLLKAQHSKIALDEYTPMKVSEICFCLHCSRNAMMINLSRLEDVGLIALRPGRMYGKGRGIEIALRSQKLWKEADNE